jgi:hypothetical protein
MFSVHRDFTTNAAALVELFPYSLDLESCCPLFENIVPNLGLLHSKMATQKCSSLDSFKCIVNSHQAITDRHHCLRSSIAVAMSWHHPRQMRFSLL